MNSKADHFLAKGEQMELSVENLKNFSVGNKEVLKYKFLPSKSQILIKGKKLGFSDLIIWTNQGEKQVHHFYITSKQEQLKKMEIAQILKNTQLKTKISGDMIFIQGEVKALKTYFLLKKLMKKKNKNLIFDTKLSRKLTREIIAKVYQDFYEQDASLLNCKELNAQITCVIRSSFKHEQLINFFTKHYHINFQYFEQAKPGHNFILKFKIVSIDSDQMENRNSDFARIETELTSLIQEKKLFTGESIFFQNQNTAVSMLAEPELSIVENKPFKIQLGAEVPVPTRQGNQGTTVQWKFVGLNINGKLKLIKQNYLLNYQSNITKAQENNISGPKGESTLYLKPNNLTKLYSVDMQTDSTNIEEVPLISNIPILRSLFQNKSHQFSQKKVIVFALLEEI